MLVERWCTPQEPVEAGHSVITAGEAGERTSELVWLWWLWKLWVEDAVLQAALAFFLSCVRICSHVAKAWVLGLREDIPSIGLDAVARTCVRRCWFPRVVCGGWLLRGAGKPAAG